MAELDLTKLPDQPTLDLTTLPDQPTETSTLDLASLPDQPESTEPGLLRKTGKVALEGLLAPFELAGETVRFSRESDEFRLPSLAKTVLGEGVRDVPVPGGQVRLTTEKVPGEFISEITSGIQGLVQTGLSPLFGQDPIQAGAREVRRPKTEPMDLVNQLAFAFASGPVGAAPLTALGKSVAGLTKAGQRVAGRVVQGQRVQNTVKNAVQAEKDTRILKARPLVQKEITDAATITKGEKVKLFKRARNLEEKVEQTGKAFDEFNKQSTFTITPTPQEKQLIFRVGKLKVQRSALAAKIIEEKARLSFSPRDLNIVKKFDNVNDRLRFLQNNKTEILRNKLKPLQDEMLDVSKTEAALRDPNNLNLGLMTRKQQNLLATSVKKKNELQLKFNEKLQQEVTKINNQITGLQSSRKQLANKLKTNQELKIEQLQKEFLTSGKKLDEVESTYNTIRKQRFVEKKQDLAHIAAKAENDLIDFGASSEQIQNRFITLINRKPETIMLPETLAEARNIAGITKVGNVPISRNVVDSIKQIDDISGFERTTGQLTSVGQKLDDFAQGSVREEIINPLIDNVYKKAQLEHSFITRIKDIMNSNKLDVKADSVPLRLFIEKKAGALVGKEQQYTKAGKQIEEMFDELLTLQNEHNIRLGLPKINKLSDYVHHMRNQAVADDLLLGAEETKNFLSTGRTLPKLGFDQKRLDAIPEEELGGVFEALEAYALKVARSTSHGEDALKFKALQAEAQKAGKPNLALFFNSIGNRLTNDSHRIGNLALKEAFGGAVSKEAQEFMRKIQNNFVSNVIVGNVGAAVNQVGAQIIASKFMGVGRSLGAIPEGMVKNLWEKIIKASINPNYRSFARQNSRTVRLFDSDTLRRMDQSKAKMPEQVGSWLFNYMNESVVIGTFNQAFKSAKIQGRSDIEAFKIADEIAQLSQGIYKDVFRPSIISSTSPGGQFVLPLSTYVFNAMNTLKSDLPFMSKLPVTEKAAALGRVAATGFLLNVATNSLTGRQSVNFADLIPGLRPAQFGLSGALAIGPLVGQAVTEAGQAVGSLARGEAPRFPRRLAEQAFLLANPKGFGLQAIKTAKGTTRLLTGKTRDPRELIFGPIPKKKR